MRSPGLRLAGLLLGVALSARAQGPKELNVFAAASLRESFGELGKLFEATHPGTKVQLNLGGSQELRTQIENGAPADVFASADQKAMQGLVAAKLARPSRVFARNEPVLVVQKGNAAAVARLHGLPQAERSVVRVPGVSIG